MLPEGRRSFSDDVFCRRSCRRHFLLISASICGQNIGRHQTFISEISAEANGGRNGKSD